MGVLEYGEGLHGIGSRNKKHGKGFSTSVHINEHLG